MELLASQKSSFSISAVLKGINKKKIKNHSKPPKFLSQSLLKQFKQIPNIFLVFHWNFNPFAFRTPLGGWLYQPTFAKQYLKNNKSKHCLYRTSFKRYSIIFLMLCRLIDFALAVRKLLMFKVCEIIGISKIEFFDFSGTERFKQNQKKLKTI